MRMRFRTDGWHYADLKTHGWRFAEHMGEEGEKVYGTWLKTQEEFDKWKAEWDAVPKAEPGDVWRIHWYRNEGEPEGPIAGYAICCTGCGHVHDWTIAGNCGQKVDRSYVDSNTGETVHYQSCVHSGVGSCWTWTGSAEEGTLSGAPSLQVVESGAGCHWHGYLTNGDLHAC